jgi:DNA-binding NarL/FixJ family response regulator
MAQDARGRRRPRALRQTNKEIAAEVFLSDKTVKNCVSSILAKLNLERRAQAAAYVARVKSVPSD